MYRNDERGETKALTVCGRTAAFPFFIFYFLIQFPFTDDEIKENGVPKSSYFVSARSICFLFLHTQIYMKNPVSLQCVGDNLATMLSY